MNSTPATPHLSPLARVRARLSAIWRRPIIFDGYATPVKTALFVILCAAWILPGLIGHDPWKTEATTMGIVHAMLLDGAWLTPNVAGIAHHDYPPLYYWVAAILAKTFSALLPPHDGARLATGLFMAITLVYTRKTARRLFDERAGRISVVLLIGSLGIFVRGHEMNPELGALAGTAIALYGMTRIRSETMKGGVTTGVGIGIVAMSVGIVPALAVPMVAILLVWMLREWRNRLFQRGIMVAVLISLAIMAIYPLALLSQGEISRAMWIDAILGAPFLDVHTRSAIDPIFFLRRLAWYTLPALPFALWLWWRERKLLRERFEVALPLVGFLVFILWVSFLREANDAVGAVLLLPLVLAASSALDRLPRSSASFVDWFSLLFFGLAAATIWFYWFAAITGFPQPAANLMAREAPNFVFSFAWTPFGFAAILTSIWLYAVARAHRNSRRAMVNWAAGVTLVWMLGNVLALPALNHTQSYRNTVQAITAHIGAPPQTCIAAVNLGDPVRAMLDYFGGVRVVPIPANGSTPCEWLITQSKFANADTSAVTWRLIWQGGRPRDESEQFLRLYQRESNVGGIRNP